MKSAVTSVIVLIASLCIVLGPWMLQLEVFGDALTPDKMGELLPMIGGVLLAWLGRSPLPKQR
jgi:hypothetical protein